MFDIGFWEICLIGIVGLLVIGPDRLPGVARTVGRWVGKAQRMVNGVKSDINRELEAGELRELLGEQKKQIQALQGLVGDTKSEVESSTRDAIAASEKSWAEEVAEFHAQEEKQQSDQNTIMPPPAGTAEGVATASGDSAAPPSPVDTGDGRAKSPPQTNPIRHDAADEADNRTV